MRQYLKEKKKKTTDPAPAPAAEKASISLADYIKEKEVKAKEVAEKYAALRGVSDAPAPRVVDYGEEGNFKPRENVRASADTTVKAIEKSEAPKNKKEKKDKPQPKGIAFEELNFKVGARLPRKPPRGDKFEDRSDRSGRRPRDNEENQETTAVNEENTESNPPAARPSNQSGGRGRQGGDRGDRGDRPQYQGDRGQNQDRPFRGGGRGRQGGDRVPRQTANQGQQGERVGQNQGGDRGQFQRQPPNQGQQPRRQPTPQFRRGNQQQNLQEVHFPTLEEVKMI